METLGFLDGDPLNCSHLGSLGRAVERGVNLQDAIETFRRLLPSFAQGNTVWLEHDPRTAWLCCHTDHLDPAAHVPNDYTLLILIALVRSVAGPDWRPLAMRCQTTATRSGRELTPFSDIETSFQGNSSAIALPCELLTQAPAGSRLEIRTSDGKSPPAPSIADSLQQILKSLLGFRPLPSCEEAAEMLEVSRRTLLRALHKEGLTYQRLVDRVRYKAACRLLEQGDNTIEEIAGHLGYSSASNFVRAFRRLGTITPTQYRRDLELENQR